MKNIILGSGLVSLICKKLITNSEILPLGPSRFYSQGVPGWGDDFIVYNEQINSAIINLGCNLQPLFFKRPINIAGNLLYNSNFLEHYLNKIGLNSDSKALEYYKTNFMVYSFSCIQLWEKLKRQLIGDIKSFYDKHAQAKKILLIKDHEIFLDNGDVIEYDNLISTVPYYVLCRYLKIEDNNDYEDIYYYYIKDNKIDIENANQVLICDVEIPFNKCTKISNNKYMLEIIGNYYDDIYNALYPILGGDFEILKAHMVEKGHIYGGAVDQKTLNDNDIFCIGSYAQCDPLINLGNDIQRIMTMMNKINGIS